MIDYRATCPYCDWDVTGDDKQTVQHERFEHVWHEHESERKIPWNKDIDPVEEIGDE